MTRMIDRWKEDDDLLDEGINPYKIIKKNKNEDRKKSKVPTGNISFFQATDNDLEQDRFNGQITFASQEEKDLFASMDPKDAMDEETRLRTGREKFGYK